MPLCSAACVGLSPHVDTCQTSHRDSAKERNPRSLKQTRKTFMSLASLVQYMYFRRFKIYQFHLQELPPISFILPQLCAHGALKVIKQHVTEFVLSLTLHQIIPLLHPLSSPPAVSGAPGLRCPQHPRRRPRRGAAPRRRRGRGKPPRAAVSDLRRRRARRRQRLAPPAHCSGRNCTLWSEVREFHLFLNCIASWFNGSHYLLLVFVKITKTTNWWHLPEKDIRKGEKTFSYA